MKASAFLLQHAGTTFLKIAQIPTGEKGVSVKTAWKLAKLVDPVFAEQRRVTKIHEKLLEEHVKRDEKGEKVEVARRGPEIQYALKDQAAWEAAFEELLSLELELPKKGTGAGEVTFALSEFDKCESISARELAALSEWVTE